MCSYIISVVNMSYHILFEVVCFVLSYSAFKWNAYVAGNLWEIKNRDKMMRAYNKNKTHLIILKIGTEGNKTRCAGSLFQDFTTRNEKAQLLRRRRLGSCSNRCLWSRSTAQGRRRAKLGGFRSNKPVKMLKARMRSARSLDVAARIGWVVVAFPHKARDEVVSQAV